MTIYYDELRIRFEPAEEGRYKVSAFSPVGDAKGEFALPFVEFELENFVLKMTRSPRGLRRIESPQRQRMTDFGRRLFDALFNSRVRDLYRSSLQEAQREDKGLRISLSLSETPELMNVPWEYMYDEAEPDFISISGLTPIVRYLDLPYARRPLRIDFPIRILGVVSSPRGAATLNVQRERDNLEGALRLLTSPGSVRIVWLEDPSLRSLQRKLRQDKYHILHYIGHGIYDAEAEDGVLLLEGSDGRAQRVSGADLGTILADHTSLQLAVLNACEGARTSANDPFAGVAASLVRRQIPAVIAMQFEITDQAAIAFAEDFYLSLAEGLSVDSALAEARKAIFASHNDVEWGTPVLFARVSDGRLFDIPSQSDRPHEPERHVLEATSEARETPAEDDVLDEAVEPALARYSPDPHIVARASPELEVEDTNPTHVTPAAAAPAAIGMPAEAGEPQLRLEEHYKRVIRKMLNGLVVPYLGAEINIAGRPTQQGFDFRYPPTHSELAEYLSAKFLDSVAERDLPRIAYTISLTEGWGELYAALHRALEAGYTSGPVHNFLARLQPMLRESRRQLQVILTTNYDDALERAFAAIGEEYDVLSYVSLNPPEHRGRFAHLPPGATTPIPIEQPNEYTALDLTTRAVIVKMNGGITRRGSFDEDNYVVTEDDYTNYLAYSDITQLLPPPIPQRLRNSHLLFLGYSVADWSLRVSLQRIWGTQSLDYPSWSIQRRPGVLDYKFWGNRAVAIFDVDVDHYVNGLRSAIVNRMGPALAG
jgi:hypothetical protein